MNKTVAIWVLLGLVSSPIYAETREAAAQKALEKSWEKIPAIQGPEIEGNLQEFNYILVKYVYQGKASMLPGAIPRDFQWRCVDLINGCFQVGQKYSLPDNFYPNPRPRMRHDLAANPDYQGH